MNQRHLIQLTGLGLVLLSASSLLYRNLTAGKPYQVPEVNVSAPTLGADATRQLTLVADLRCPHCAAFDILKGQILEERAQAMEMRLQYLLVARQPGSEQAGNAALCVFEQDPDAFWRYKSAVYAMPQLSESALLETAKSLGLDPSQLTTCIRENRYGEQLEQNEQLVRTLGIQGTPTLITDSLAYSNPSTAALAEVIGD